MIALLFIVLARYCYSLGDTRQSLFKAFLELDTKDAVVTFLNDCIESKEYICHVNNKMDRDCYDVYVHYFEVVGSASFQDNNMKRLIFWSNIYSEQALQHMIVKSILDDDLLLLAGAAVTLGITAAANYQFLQNIELKVFENGPKWTVSFNKLPKMHNLLKYALNLKSFKTYMMVYYYAGAPVQFVQDTVQSNFKYIGAGFRRFFPYLEQKLPERKPFIKLFRFLKQALPEKGVWTFDLYIFEYFRNLSITKYSTKDLVILNAIKQFAESYLEHYLLSNLDIFNLLTRSDLKHFSTLEYLKGRIRDRVMADCSYEKAYSLTELSVYYENVDMITDGEWAEKWKDNLETNGYDDTLWQPYRGAAISTRSAMVNSKIILAYCTSSNTCRLVFNSLEDVTQELDEKKYLRVLLSQYGIEYTWLALSVVKQMGIDDANEIIEQLRGPSSKKVTRAKKSHKSGTTPSQSKNSPFLKNVDAIINSKAACATCREVIQSNSGFKVLPCGHVIHDWHNSDAHLRYRCSVCGQYYSFAKTEAINLDKDQDSLLA